ncbi:MAG: hypothetical protein ACE5J2_07560 [Nitrososphaerales archaeon]
MVSSWIDEYNTCTRLGEITDSSGDPTATVDVQIPPSADPGKYYVIQATDADYNVYYITFLVI